MQQWEYTTNTWDDDSDFQGLKMGEGLEAMLNVYGRDGWEVVGTQFTISGMRTTTVMEGTYQTFPTDHGLWMFILKRPKSS
jgi:VCBS repeat-containing protein